MQGEPGDNGNQAVPPFDAIGPNDGEIRDAIERGGRVMVAAIHLPDRGTIPDDQKERVREVTLAIRERFGLSYRAIARQLGPSASESILSEVLRGKYRCEDSPWIRRLNSWNESYLRRQEAAKASAIVRTGVVRGVKALAEYARSQGCITAGFGPAGVGKTVSAQLLASEDPSTVYMRLRSVHTGAASFLRTLAEAVGVESKGSGARTAEAIIERLAASHRLIVTVHTFLVFLARVAGCCR